MLITTSEIVYCVYEHIKRENEKTTRSYRCRTPIDEERCELANFFNGNPTSDIEQLASDIITDFLKKVREDKIRTNGCRWPDLIIHDQRQGEIDFEFSFKQEGVVESS